MIELWPQQVPFVGRIRSAFAEHDSVIAQGPTGFGKTVVASYVAHNAMMKGNSVTFACHRKNLIRQTCSTFQQFGIPHGIIAAGHPGSPGAQINVASIWTLARRLNQYDRPDLLVVDEAHLAMATTWHAVVSHVRDQGGKVLGLTATPRRLDGKPLGNLFDTLVLGPTPRELIDAGYLSDYRAYAPSQPDLSGVRKQMGDWAPGELAKRMTPAIIGDAAEHYQKHCPGRRAIAYCPTIAHSKETCLRMQAKGIAAAHIDGHMSQDEITHVIERMAHGEITVLCNCELITTGFDLSAQIGRELPIEAIIVLRSTQSVALHLQMLGRGLRRKPEPAVILDHAGNLLRHGLPDDDYDWTLTGRDKKLNGEASIAIRQCPECYFVHRPASECPECGYQYTVEAREINEVDGELEELTRKQERKHERMKEGMAKTFGELVSLGKARGYKNPYGWAHHRMVGRAKSIDDLERYARDRGYKNPVAWAEANWK